MTAEMATPEEAAYRRLLYRRVMDTVDAGLVPIWFSPQVLDKYRGQPGHRIIRTNTAARLRTPGWQLDFGIAADDALLHASFRDVVGRLPEGERGHWADHAVGLPLSRFFTMAQLSPGTCVDDGDVREW